MINTSLAKIGHFTLIIVVNIGCADLVVRIAARFPLGGVAVFVLLLFGGVAFLPHPLGGAAFLPVLWVGLFFPFFCWLALLGLLLISGGVECLLSFCVVLPSFLWAAFSPFSVGWCCLVSSFFGWYCCFPTQHHPKEGQGLPNWPAPGVGPDLAQARGWGNWASSAGSSSWAWARSGRAGGARRNESTLG